MLKQVVSKYSIGKAVIYGSNREKLIPFLCQTSRGFHHGQPVVAPRSFFGVEDYEGGKDFEDSITIYGLMTG